MQPYRPKYDSILYLREIQKNEFLMVYPSMLQHDCTRESANEWLNTINATL